MGSDPTWISPHYIVHTVSVQAEIMRDGVSLVDSPYSLSSTFAITIYHTCFSHVIDKPDDIIKNYQFSDPFDSLNTVRLFTTTWPACPVDL